MPWPSRRQLFDGRGYMSMHAAMKNIWQSIKQTDIYARTKASWIYDVYWSMANRKIIEDREKEIEFYRDLLFGFRRGNSIFDIGANRGYKTGIFLKLGAHVVSVEPDEAAQRALKQRFVSYRLTSRPVIVVPKAVSEKSSVERMWIDTPGSPMNTLSRKWADTLRSDAKRFGEKLDFGECKEVETVSIDELIKEHGSPFFVKIDVEGHELSVLRGLHRPVPYLSFEINLPEFRQEGLECVRRLEQLARSGLFNYTADCRVGMALKEWVNAEGCSAALNACNSSSIEVFWKTVL